MHIMNVNPKLNALETGVWILLFLSSAPLPHHPPTPCPIAWASFVTQNVKNLSAMKETWVWSLGQEASAREGNGYKLQYSCLYNSMDKGAWRLQSMGLQRDGYDWATNAITFTFHCLGRGDWTFFSSHCAQKGIFFFFFLARLSLGNKVLQKFWSLARVYITEAKGFRPADTRPYFKVTL